MIHTAKQRSQPLKKLAIHSTSTCSLQATTYAKCIVATYKDVTRDICATEFLQFKICLRDAVRHERSLHIVVPHIILCTDEEILTEKTTLLLSGTQSKSITSL